MDGGLVRANRTEAQMSSVRLFGSEDLSCLTRPWNQRPQGYRPDDPRWRWNLTPADSDEDQRSGGYETQPEGGGLRQRFLPFEGATRASVTSSPTRLVRKCELKDTLGGARVSTQPTDCIAT